MLLEITTSLYCHSLEPLHSSYILRNYSFPQMPFSYAFSSHICHCYEFYIVTIIECCANKNEEHQYIHNCSWGQWHGRIEGLEKNASICNFLFPLSLNSNVMANWHQSAVKGCKFWCNIRDRYSFLWHISTFSPLVHIQVGPPLVASYQIYNTHPESPVVSY